MAMRVSEVIRTIRCSHRAAGVAEAFVFRRKAISLAVAALLAGTPAVFAGQPGQILPAGTIPQVRGVVYGQATVNAPIAIQGGNRLTIDQTSQKAIIEWNKFDIARGSEVRFNQPGSSSSTLNRIYDIDPSVIQGNLSATGQIYLINQNGILFDRGSQVNVGGLVASTLNIADELFKTNLLSVTDPSKPAFAWEGSAAQFGDSFVRVEEGAVLSTSAGGRVMIFAPKVENRGSIATPEGQTILAAGAKVYLSAPLDASLRGFLVEVDPYVGTDAAGTAVNLGGQAINDAVGKIVAERGNVTIAALAVNQMGRVSATTSVNLNGSVRLLARDSALVFTDPASGVALPAATRTGALVLGESSVTEVLPDRADTRTILDEQTFTASRIEMVGRSIHLQENARVVAPGGNVTLTAQLGRLFQLPGEPAQDGVRVYFESGSIVDVSGTQDVPVPVERNIVQVELRGTELADSPLQRNSFLRGQTVSVDVRKGTPFADISGTVAQIGRGVGEKTAAGGTVAVKSEGDIVLRSGSAVDVSGGSLRYSGGYLNTTKLVSGGRIYDISTADPNLVYTAVVGTYVAHHDKWGVTETFSLPIGGWFEPGYVEGRNAGSASFVAHGLVFDGDVRGSVVAGPLQRELASRPLAGRLVIGDGSQSGALGGADFKIGDVLVAASRNPLPADFSFDNTTLPDPWRSQVTLSTDQLSAGGLGRLEVYSNGRISIDNAAALNMPAGGSVVLTGRQLDVAGDITAQGGSIVLATREILDSTNPVTLTRADVPLYVRSGVKISTQGGWVNDNPLTGTADPLAPVVVNGGSVTIRSGGDVRLEAGSVVDVSGGGWVNSSGKLKKGNAGSISIATGRVGLSESDTQESEMVLDGELRAYALGTGGSLSLDASQVSIGAPAQSGRVLSLAPDFFRQGGFSRYTVNGQDGLSVAPGTDVTVLSRNLVLDSTYQRAPTGADVSTIATIAMLPGYLRTPGALMLSAASGIFGELTIGTGARVAVDPAGSISLTAGRQMTVLGTVSAPGGDIQLSTTAPGSTETFLPGQSIWLGSTARLLATGVYVPAADAQGLRRGDVLDGGSVTIHAAKGYVVTQAGSLIDASGAQALMDLPTLAGGRTSFAETLVGSHGGSIVLSAREGVLADGSLSARAGGATASGGNLAVAVQITDASPFLPNGDRVAVVRSGGTAVPSGLAPGDQIDQALFNGKAYVNADIVARGGFDSLAVSARDRIEIEGAVNLSLRRSIVLDAPVIAGTANAAAQLNAAYVALGNSNVALQSQQTSAGGTGILAVSANMIDLLGKTALRGFGDVRLEAGGDIRLRGVLQGSNGSELAGSVESGGNLTLRAAQIYPTTLTNFSLAVRGVADGTIRFERAAGSESPVLSAGGNLTVEAPRIEQAGVLKAPLGQIALNGSDSVTLEPGSLTSVSAEGQIIPLGRTELSGHDYVYVLDSQSSLILDRPPEKRIRLSGADVDVRSGAVMDLSGGGDLYAYEFVAGPGGTRDVLDPSNAAGAYAVLPSLGTRYAPYDNQYYQGVAGLAPGDAVYLSGGPGLPAGYYTLLPARYALLPGAYLVKPVSGYQDLLAGTTAIRADGSQIVAGYRAWLTSAGISHDTRSSGFEVRPGAAVRAQSEYHDSLASKFFAANDVPLPVDAGGLSVVASRALALDGTLLAAAAAGGRGADVDIEAQKLAVLGAGMSAPDGDFVRVDVASLMRLNADSLLLGGTREFTGDHLVVGVGADEVYVATGASGDLRLPDLIVAARDRVTVAAGSVLEGSGGAGIARGLQIGDAQAAGSGDGALLRVTSGGSGALLRQGVARTRGTLDVSSGAVVRASGSVILDATLENRSDGTLSIAPGGTLQIGANRISVGTAPEATEGLTFSNEILDTLNHLGALVLRSYSTFDVYGAAEFGSPALKAISIESAGIGGFLDNGQSAHIVAGTVSLSNPNGLPFSSPPGSAPGDGSLVIDAGKVVLGSATNGAGFALRGFSNVEVRAAKEISVEGTGDFSATGDMTLAASRVTAATQADYSVSAGGRLKIERPARVADDLDPVTALGARLTLSGTSVMHSGDIELPAGTLSLVATGSNANDSVTLAAGSRIVTRGLAVAFADTSVAASAGSVTLKSADGGVTLAEGATVDLRGIAGGDAGSLAVLVPNGTVRMDGVLLAYAEQREGETPRQGSFILDAGSLANFSALNAKLNQAGFNESRDIRVRSGDIIVAAGNPFTQRPADTVTARNVQLATDDGDILVGGIIDASGIKGGSIVLAASRKSADTAGAGNVILSDGAILDASSTAAAASVADANGHPFGTRGEGGTVLLSSNGAGIAGDVGVDVRGGSIINVASAGVAANGGVTLRAPRINDDTEVLINPIAGTIASNAAGIAPVTVVAEAVRIYDGVSNIGDAAGAGRLTFAQVDSDNSAFMANAAAINARLGGARVRTGVEVRSAGDLTLDTDWNLYSASRAGNEPGVLTLRAAGNLVLNGSVSDGFSTAATTATLQSGDSWSYRLVGGADLAAAAPLAVMRTASPSSGDVIVGAGKLVRTGTGSIDIGAGRDIDLVNQGSVIYTAGAPATGLPDFNVTSIGGAAAEFPTRGGDVSLQAQRDIASFTGSTQLVNNWLYRQGKLDAQFSSQFRNVAWWPRFRDFQQGVGALGGGDVTADAGRNISNLSISLPTNGRLPGRFGSMADASRLTVQGGGDLDVSAGGNIDSAVFFVDRGTGHVRAGGSLGSARSVMVGGIPKPLYTTVALGDALVGIETAGDLALESVVNPTILSQASQNKSDTNRISFFSTYSDRSSLHLTSQGGSVTLSNDVAKMGSAYASLLGTAGRGESDALVMYPGDLLAASLSADLKVNNGFQMFPASGGNLELLAHGSVTVAYAGDLISMSDVRPALLPSPAQPAGSFVTSFGTLIGNASAAGFSAHSDPLLHLADEEPVRIIAETGDITGPISVSEGAFPIAVLPKAAIIAAGRDVRDTWIFVQNLRREDVTSVRAGRDIVFDTLRDAAGNQRSNSGRIEIGGPGTLQVVAGRNVDLGNSGGIVSRGNLNNPYLTESGADIVVRAGALDADYDKFIQHYIIEPPAGQPDYAEELTAYMRSYAGDATLTAAQALEQYMNLPSAQKTGFANQVFYTELREAGRAAGRTAGGLERYARGFSAIAELFPAERDGKPAVYQGDVNLFFSQIKTEQGGDIDIMAPGGLVNAGLANPGSLAKPASQLGIVTVKGGSIRSYVRDDFQVNQSRVFTLQGGDILIWSSYGNIDAGKGAKTARATPPPQLIVRGDQFVLDTTNSVAGSGIAVLLALEGIAPGDVDLIAPRGEVNAGDAGIRAAGNINIAAVRVVGADNIQVGGTSTGVPPTESAGVSSAVAGASNVGASAAKSAEEVTKSLASASAMAPKEVFRPSFITVELLGIGDENSKEDTKEK